MSKKEKLVKRLKSRSKDCTFEEVENLLQYFDYKCCNKGRTGGSRIAFKNEQYATILLYKPHARKIVFDYQIKELIEDFHGAVDAYLELCREAGEEPEKAYKGSFNIRISPEIHKQIAVHAMSQQVFLNSLVERALQDFVMLQN